MASLRDRFTTTYSSFWSSETAVMLTMALLVGLGSGYAAVAFRWLIDATQAFFFEVLPSQLANLGAPGSPRSYVTLLSPALGGLLVGLLAQAIAPETEGPGVASVMEALALRGGRMRPIVIAAKPVTTSLTVGSGGSAGREGPVVQIGSAIGSTLSQLARLSDERTKNLVACGAAGGIAATFNAPLAGVMFALEVLLAEFGLVQFTSVVVAAVMASVVGHTAFGDVPAFAFPPSTAAEPWELPIYAVMGVVAAFLGVAFIKVLYRIDEVLESETFPRYLTPAVGGLLVGIIGRWFPRVLGVGYESIEAVLFNRLTLTSIILLGLFKILVTSFTIGSGGSGGIFAPCLFIGAMLGGLFGQLVQRAAPGMEVPSSYAIVGMSAVFAAASRAPITAILTLFEMTRDYSLILPLMLASVISAILARGLLQDSIYTVKLSRRGIDVRAGRNLDLMSTILVGEAMTDLDEVTTVRPSTRLAELARIFDETHHHGLLVLDEEDCLHGIVSLTDLEETSSERLVTGRVADIQATNVHTVFPDQTLKAALQSFGGMDLGRIPVVDRADPRHVVGLLRRGDIVRAYSEAALDQQARRIERDGLKLWDQAGVEAGPIRSPIPVVEIRLRDQHQAVGRTLQELDLPSQSLIVSIRRGGQVLIPHGDTQLEAGDVVVALVAKEEEKPLHRRLTERGGDV